MSENCIPDLGGENRPIGAVVQECATEKNWVEVGLVDDAGEPQAGTPYRIYNADGGGLLASGSLNADGRSGVVALPLDVSSTYAEYGNSDDLMLAGDAPVDYEGPLKRAPNEDDNAYRARIIESYNMAQRVDDPAEQYAQLDELTQAIRNDLGLYPDLSLEARSPAEAAEVFRQQGIRPDALTNPGVHAFDNSNPMDIYDIMDGEKAFQHENQFIFAGPDGRAYVYDPAETGQSGPPIHQLPNKIGPLGQMSRILRETDRQLEAMNPDAGPSALEQIGDAIEGAIFGSPAEAAAVGRPSSGAGARLRRSNSRRQGSRVNNKAPVRTKNPAAVKRTTTHALVFTRQMRDYLKGIEASTGRKLSPKQRRLLARDLDQTGYSKRVSPSDHAKHRAEFDRKKGDLIREWETQTGQKWPQQARTRTGRNGVTQTKTGPQDAHEIIPNMYGGPLKWHNIHPARFPDQHQRLIHGTGSPIHKVFPK